MDCKKKQHNQITEFNRRQKRVRKYETTAKLYESQVNSINNALKSLNTENSDNTLLVTLPKKREYRLNKMSSNQLRKLKLRMYNEQRYVNFCKDKMKKNLNY